MLTFERPDGPPDWTPEWVLWFLCQITTVDGEAIRLAPFQVYHIRQAFDPSVDMSLWLLPKGQGKSTIIAGVAIWHMLVVPNCQVLIGASTRDQTKHIWLPMVHIIDSEPEIAAQLHYVETTKIIKCTRDHGYAQVLSSDKTKGGGQQDGTAPTLAIIDELHAHLTPHLYTSCRRGLHKRKWRNQLGHLRHAQMAVISTAGPQGVSVLGSMRDTFLACEVNGGTITNGLRINDDGDAEPHADGRLTVARIGKSLMLEWALDLDRDDPHSMADVKLVNPAPWISEEGLQSIHDDPGVPPWEWLRYHAGVWTLANQSWLLPGQWDDLAQQGFTIPDGERVWVGVDMGRYHDCAAVVVAWPIPDTDRIGVVAKIWRSGGQNDPIPYSDVTDHLLELDEQYELATVAYDSRYFDMAAEMLEDRHGLPMELYPQSNERMCPASANFRAAIVSGRVVHDGDGEFADHINAAEQHDINPVVGWRLVKASFTSPPIDAAIAACMAVDVCQRPDEELEAWVIPV